MPSLPLLRAIGLNFSPNQLDAPAGSLVEASNVIIRRDNVIESRRGFSVYGTPMGNPTDRCKQLLIYKNKIIRHYSDKLQFENGLNNSGITDFFDFNEIQSGVATSATITEADSSIRIKGIESNGNFYFTSSEGIKKISSKSSDSFPASNITQAGGIKALDTKALLDVTLGDSASFLPGDAGVAYKIVWGTKDANNNLILGAPSDATTVLNPLINLTLKDFSNFLLQLDNTASSGKSLISDTNYSSLALPSDSLSSVLRENLILLAKKLDEDLMLASVSSGGTAYNPLKLASFVSKTANVVAGSNSIVVSPDSSGILIGMTLIADGVFGTVTNVAGNTVTLSQNATITNTSANLIFSSVSITSGIVKLIFDPLSLPSKYFVTGDSIYVPADNTVSPSINGFTSNGFTVDSLNKNNSVSNVSSAFSLNFSSSSVNIGTERITINNHGLLENSQIVFNTSTGSALPSPLTVGTIYYAVNVTLNDFQISLSSGGAPINLTTVGSGTNFVYAGVPSYIEFVARDFNITSNPSGVSGTISNIPVLSAFSNGGLILTSTKHGLKNGQKITIVGSNSSANINGTYNVVVLSENTFSIQLGVQYTGISASLSATPPSPAGDLVITTAVNHGFTAGTIVQFSATSFTNTNLVANKDYYVLSSGLTANQFKVSESPTGTPIIQNGLSAGAGVLVSKYIKTAGTAASWSVIVDDISTLKIESNLFRSIQEPVEQTSVPATSDQIRSLQTYLSKIVQSLQGFITERTPNVVDSVVYQDYLEGISETNSAKVVLQFTIPPDVLEYTAAANPYFYQVYRTSISQAEGVSVIGDPLTFGIIQEYTQIEETFPSSSDFTNKYVTFTDNSPESIAGTGANLYTNSTSSGDPSANDIPPFALDIATFKGYTFFANTRTRQRKLITLLPIVNMIQKYSTFGPYELTITDKTSTNTYSFVTGIKQQTTLTCGSASSLFSSGESNYFLLNSANDEFAYYVWFQAGSSVDPFVPNKKGIKVVVNLSDSSVTVASKVKAAISNVMQSFTANSTGNVVTITNVDYGAATSASLPTPILGFSLSTASGRGENSATRQVLLYGDLTTSPSVAIEETARSLIRVINQNANEIVNGFYLSGSADAPGSILLEGRKLKDDPVYLLASDNIIGECFNPSLSPSPINILSVSQTNPAIVTTSTDHGLVNGNSVIITNSTTTPNINGIHTITWLSPSSFSIPVNVTVAGTAAFKDADLTESTTNDKQPHHVYFSKFQQPESVPILNYIQVGATDRKILRIFPLRDSLFVFKEDGLFRISGDVTPFNVTLFDSSCILLAADSLSLANNQLFGWTTQGISGVTEAGVTLLSRPIDTEILRKASSEFVNFKSATWGVGYESDNSYTVYTTKNTTDSIPNIGFRYSTLTNSWTTVDKTANCGIINTRDDRMYLGAGDINYLEKEKKNFNRYDYSDREYAFSVTSTNFTNNKLTLSDINNVSVGDVLVQEQSVTIYEFNSLLRKLDNDPGISTDYYATLAAKAGDNMRERLVALAQKLDLEPSLSGGYYALIQSRSGSVTSADVANPALIITSLPHNIQNNRYVVISNNTRSEVNGVFKIAVVNSTSFTIPVDLLAPGTGGSYLTDDENFEDLKICYNYIINALNNDPGTIFTNYRLIDNYTTQEIIITKIDSILKTLEFNLKLDLIQGPIIIHNAIPCSFTYSPITFDDSLGLKHIREATMMFSNKAFTEALIKFSTDLLPEFIPVEFKGDGNGVFGHSAFGGGFFGGTSNSAPFRTYVPRQCQRCRFINVGFEHRVAREQFSIYGISLTAELAQSTRAYR